MQNCAERINQLKKYLVIALKALVSVGSLYLVSRSIAWVDVNKALQQADYSLMVLALLIFWIAQIFSALRCAYIARTLGGELDLQTSLSAHFVGLWFNQVMPTSLGGDVVKMAILRKPLGLSIAIRSAILDRVSGLMFLLVIMTITLPLYANLFPSNRNLVAALSIISIGGGLTVIGCAWAAHYISGRYKINSFLFKFVQIFSDVWAFRKITPLWQQSWTSAIVHFNGIVTYGLIGYALGVNVDLLTFLLVVPVVFLIALIPVSFAGWGVREIGAVWLFGMIGIDNEHSLAMSICFGLLLVLAGLPGLFQFLRLSMTRRIEGKSAS